MRYNAIAGFADQFDKPIALFPNPTIFERTALSNLGGLVADLRLEILDGEWGSTLPGEWKNRPDDGFV